MCKIYNDSYQNNIANKCRMQTHIPVTFLLALERVPGRPYVAMFRSVWLIRVEYFPNSFGIRARIREIERERKKSDCLSSIEDPAWVTLCDGWEWLTKAKLCFWKHKQDGFSIKYSSSTTRVYCHFFLSLSVSRPFFSFERFFSFFFSTFLREQLFRVGTDEWNGEHGTTFLKLIMEQCGERAGKEMAFPTLLLPERLFRYIPDA